MKKLLVTSMSIVFILGIGGTIDQPMRVEAEPAKTKCLITESGGFFCEGNPGYEDAKMNFKGN